jgi:hypothetical protein
VQKICHSELVQKDLSFRAACSREAAKACRGTCFLPKAQKKQELIARSSSLIARKAKGATHGRAFSSKIVPILPEYQLARGKRNTISNFIFPAFPTT